MLRFLAACLLCAACLPWAQGVTLRICTDGRARTPLLSPGGEGLVDQLIREAAREAGLEVAFYQAPTVRCKEEIRRNLAQAYPMVPFTPSVAEMMAFPMLGEGADPARAIASQRTFVFRRVGTDVAWDGHRFSALRTPVLVPSGSVLALDRLAALQVPADASGTTLDMALAKLLGQRADAALGWEMAGLALLQQPPFAGKIEMLPLPFSEEPYYFGVSRAFYLAHQQQVERLWDAIARLRRSAAYQHDYRRLIETAPGKRKR